MMTMMMLYDTLHNDDDDNYLPGTHLAAVVERTDEQYVLVGCTCLVQNGLMHAMMMMIQPLTIDRM